MRSIRSRVALGILVVAGILALAPVPSRAQDEAAIPEPPDTTGKAAEARYANLYTGEFYPASGFDIIRTKRGSLNVSVYGLFRYLNQLPGEQTYTDHLGRTRTVRTRNDLNWHRSMVWFSGFFFEPRLRYTLTVWSLASTQQTLVFGNLRYTFSDAVTFGAGLAPNLTNRSMQGSWPYWAGSDRQMGEEFLRGGFASGFYITGTPLDRFYYNVSVNTNLSQLGVTAANDSRDLAYSASWWWLPTTGEFGPRGGLGDLEHHEQLATRFGMSACTSVESRYSPNDQPPNATQIRLSDGVYPFETGALADTVTVEKLRYQDVAFDAGFKYRGFSCQAEYMVRVLSDFQATGPLPQSSILDHGFHVEAMHMVVPKKLGLYAATSYIFDDFERKPWEVAGGANFYPFGTRSWRLNLHLIHIEKSPTGSNFGYYTAGQTGTTISLGTDILL